MTERAARKVTPEQIAVARGAFIMGDETLGQISERYYIPRGTLQRLSRNEGWRKQKDEWRKNQRAALDQALREESTRRHQDALNEIHMTRVLVARRVRQAIESGEINPTIADLERLIRLERDLDTPGWSKPASDGATNVNVGVTIETVIERVRESRNVISADADALGPSGAMKAITMAPEDVGFLLGQDDGDVNRPS